MYLAIFVTPTLAIFGFVICFSLRCRVLSFVLYFVMSCIFISCHHVHCICIRVRLMHPSIFPVVRFAIRHSYVLRRPPLLSFREWVLNILGMDRVLPSGLGIPPVDRLSSFVPFGLHLILHRLTDEPKRPRVCCSPTPLQSGPKPT